MSEEQQEQGQYARMEKQIAEYQKQGFDRDQLEELRLGLLHGVKVEAYADREYFAVQMRQLRFGLEEGLDISLYNSREYDWFQMEEIRKGLGAGLDARIYADPELSYEVMREIRRALEDNIHLEKYVALGAEMLRELHSAILDKQNILPYIQAGYVPEQLKEIRRAMKKGCDVDAYLDKGYRGAAIREIVTGLEEGLDVSSYARPEYSWQQMREIRLGLEHRVDTAVYSKELYSWQQMQEIRLGMEEKLDIDRYKSMMYTALDMRRKRLELKRKKEELENLAKKTQEEIPAYLEEHCRELPKDSLRIFVEDNGLRAFAYLGETAPQIEKEELFAQLQAEKIRKGVDADAVNELLLGRAQGRLLVIARGKLPTTGADGYYECLLDHDEQKGIRTMEDGTRDYREAYLFRKVSKGQKLLVYHPAETGEDGYTVGGEILRAAAGKEKERIRGHGYRVLEDKRTYIAEEGGCAAYDGTNLVIRPLLELPEVSNTMGDIEYDGSIHVQGDVEGGVRLRASGDIVVEGFVQNAVLESGGSILIKKGTNGRDEAEITAGSSVAGTFFENAAVRGTDISSNYFLRCDLYADEEICVYGMERGISGGNSYAGHRIETAVAGNRTGLETFLRVGYLKDDAGEESGQLKEIESQLAILKNALEQYQRKYTPEQRNAMPVFLKIENAIYTKEKDRQDVLEIQEQRTRELQEYRKAYVKVSGCLYEGTTVAINNARYTGGTRERVLLKNDAGRIKILETEEA